MTSFFISSINTLDSILLFFSAKANWFMTEGSCSFLHFFRMFMIIEIRTTRETATDQWTKLPQPSSVRSSRESLSLFKWLLIRLTMEITAVSSILHSRKEERIEHRYSSNHSRSIIRSIYRVYDEREQ